MPTEHTLRIDFHITQHGLDLDGTQQIVDASQLAIDVSQQGMHLTASQDIYPTIDDYITFGKWYKGDKGDPGTALYGTTEYWNSRVGYIPPQGTIIVYSDYSTIEVGGESVPVPGVKIGSGNGYVQDLAFVADDVADTLLAHIGNTTMHVTSSEREFWNGKINVNDSMETYQETLIFTRN